ncbi:MAG: CopG family transcriptional regulator [Cyanobium sp. CACIAM 14]|nr:MAG: CopG family transcriptional regulator [Cyanobium sp. CACIAM 14]
MAVAAAPRLSWNLRVSPDDQALIDRAVHASGLTRTDFVLQAARTAARELLVQQSWQAVPSDRFDQLLCLLDAPPSPSDRLHRTMTTARPWQR